MYPVLLGILAAILAWGINRLLVNYWGEPAIAVLVPVVEELLKTSLAFTYNSSIFLTHLTFGLIEAIWDIKTNIRGLKPGIFSVMTHSFFGLTAWLVYRISGIIFLAIMASVIAHIIWNSYIIKVSNKSKT